jgi:pimeloyl-ACP methyl ester carboxylesterase
MAEDPVHKLSVTRSRTRRQLLLGIGAFLGHRAIAMNAHASSSSAETAASADGGQAETEVGHNGDVAYGQTTLPRGIRSRFVDNNNGCTMHVLEAGFEVRDRPCVVLLHGFPELAYSWRKQLLPLARAGYHVVAPDLRGYGRSSGTDVTFDHELAPFSLLNRVSDALGLVNALGCRDVAAVVGHDYGSPIAAWCALVRPDVFRAVVLMSSPFGGPAPLPLNSANEPAPKSASSGADIFDELALLPQPRKHYQKYYATRAANDNMWRCSQGVHDFLRAYYHMKSADWRRNVPFPLTARTASEWAKMPRYYIMDLDKGMAETVAPEMPSAADIAGCKWLPDEALAVYSGEYKRTGFQGGLQAYRVRWISKYTPELQLFSGRTIDVPSLFIGGKSDWGVYQAPGAFERMQKTACTRMLGAHLVDGAGHWVQQEQPEQVNRLLAAFLADRGRQ